MLPAATMRSRARWILDEHARLGGEVTHPALAKLAEREFTGDMPYIEREELVTQAMELHVAANRGETMEDGKLTPGEVRMHARDFFSRNRTATTREAWNFVKEQGEPPHRYVSFQTSIVPGIRKELGIKAKGGKRKKSKPEAARLKAPAPARSNDRGRVDQSEKATALPPEKVLPAGSRRIEIDWGGAKLKAIEADDRWEVDFRGRVTDRQLDRMILVLLKSLKDGEEEARAT